MKINIEVIRLVSKLPEDLLLFPNPRDLALASCRLSRNETSALKEKKGMTVRR